MSSRDRMMVSAIFFLLFITALGGTLYGNVGAFLSFCFTLAVMVFPWGELKQYLPIGVNTTFKNVFKIILGLVAIYIVSILFWILIRVSIKILNS